MSENKSGGGRGPGGVGFFGLLTIVLITLKLTGNIDWTWWWVFSPLFVAIALWFALVFLVVALTAFLKTK